MSTEPLIDEDYASEEDSDFAPEAAVGEEEEGASDSESDTEANNGQAKAPKRQRTETEAPAADDFENSGDEAIVQKGKKRRKKIAADDEGGEGGFVKTRRQRAQEKTERKQNAFAGPVTVDVDAIWAQMTAAPLIPSKVEKIDAVEEHGRSGKNTNEKTDVDPGQDETDMIKIRRTYNFAGKVHTEEKLVARDSAEAKVYLASLDPNKEPEKAEEEALKPKPRKAFRSRFEPVIEGALQQRGDLNLGMNTRLALREQQAKAKKLNVVEKSRMDWAGFVDKEGIKDELELAGKSKESYTSRQDFLLRVEAKKEEEARRARIAGRG
ncbi:bucentaur or craniofacial development-domain-containing protein [Poronia punctata]|nr:bucentaur or craniofacial development-domain-containing protein [Poronia punctata]